MAAIARTTTVRTGRLVRAGTYIWHIHEVRVDIAMLPELSYDHIYDQFGATDADEFGSMNYWRYIYFIGIINSA
jgi:hypothetical protein